MQRARDLLARSSLWISLANQVVASAATFAFTVHLARTLPAAEFGTFAASMAVCMLLTGVGAAFFLAPMTATLPTMEDRREQDDLAASLLVLTMCSCLVALAGLSVFMTLSVADQGSPITRSLLAAVGVGSAANLLRNFYVRYAFATRREIVALQSNVAFSLGILLLTSISPALDAATGFWIFAVANLFAVLVGISTSKLHIRHVGMNRLKDCAKRIRGGGSWAAGGVLVNWLQTQSYLYVTAALVGVAALGAANAAKTVMAPFTFIIPAFTQVLVPQLARMSRKNSSRLARRAWLYGASMSGVAMAYFLVLYLFWPEVVFLLFHGSYTPEDLKWMVVMWSVALIFQLNRDGLSMLFQAMGIFRQLTIVSAAAAAVAMGASTALALQYGAEGAIGGVALGELALAAMLWCVYCRGGKSEPR